MRQTHQMCDTHRERESESGNGWISVCAYVHVCIEMLHGCAQPTLVISLTGNRIRMNAIPTVQIGKFIGKVQSVIHFSYILL